LVRVVRFSLSSEQGTRVYSFGFRNEKDLTPA